MNDRVAVAVVSGGLDSAVLTHHLRNHGWDLRLLSFDYGQRHAKELDCARTLAAALDVRHDVVDLTSVGRLLAGSALTDDAVDVPDGHYTDDTMKATIVPNRNAILLAIAFGHAVAVEADIVATAVHAGDHPIYPDCRPEFVHAFEKVARVGNEGFGHPAMRVEAPFLHLDKVDIVKRGAALGVPFAETWSCYRGGERHCGRCGTCVERREAFSLAGVDDPTAYEAVPV